MSAELADFTDGMPSGVSVGARIAGYRLQEQIGAGGMAVVFRATDEEHGGLVALKLLAPALASDQTFRRRFMQESRAARALNDPHIITVLDSGEANSLLWIAMNYVAGRDLRDLLGDGAPLSPSRATAIISPIASALDAAHAEGLVHRDVKPANILLDARPGRPDHVYLSDFGVSKATLSSAELTKTGHLIGTPNYIAPEQIDGKPVDGRADQYGLACSAFEMLTGDVPFHRDDVNAVLWAHLHAPRPRVTSKRGELPEAVDEVFNRALAKTPAERYPLCADFAEALRAALRIPSYDPRSASQAARDDHSADEAASPADTVAPRDGSTASDFPRDVNTTRVTEPGSDTRTALLPAAPDSSLRPGPKRPRPGRSPGPWRWLAIGAAAAVAVFSVIVLLPNPHVPGPRQADPRQVAREYIHDVNVKAWGSLCRLGGTNVVLTYPSPGQKTCPQLKANFRGNRSDAIRSITAAADTVTMCIAAKQFGLVTMQNYEIILVVKGGRIVSGKQDLGCAPGS